MAGAMVYSGTGTYEYQLELLYDSLESHGHHKWETLESISGSYDQDSVRNEMAEIKFERPVHIKVSPSTSKRVLANRHSFRRRTRGMRSAYARRELGHARVTLDSPRFAALAGRCSRSILAI